MAQPESPEVIAKRWADDGATPNNPTLPLLVYRGAFEAGADLADRIEERFLANGWQGTWRWGVYDFHHFHSTAHEVLGVASGSATLQLGGARGEGFEVAPGDVLVLPAGTGHQCVTHRGDFQVVGAYPPGQDHDQIRAGEGDLAAARQRIQAVPLPDTDPVYGPDGPLTEHWR